jgi:hypothetical protein
VIVPHHGYRLPSLSTNAPHDTRRERLTTIVRLLFPSHEIAAAEWLFNMGALHSLAAARFDGNTTQALRWLEPALAELTPASLLCAIRTRMPLEVTSATTHLADRITALTAHFFPGSSEYNAYLWLNDVAKLAELARLVREGDLPATFAWIAPAMDLAAEMRGATKSLVTPAPESKEHPLDAWKEDLRAWRDEFSVWQHAHHAEPAGQAPLAPIIIQPPPPSPSISGLLSGRRVRTPSTSPPRSESFARVYRWHSCSRSRSPVANSEPPTSVLPTVVSPPDILSPVNIYMSGDSRSGRSHSRSRSPPPRTIIMQTVPSVRRSRSRSPVGRYYEDRERRTNEPTTIVVTADGHMRSSTRQTGRSRSPCRVILTQPSVRRSRSRSRGRTRLHKPPPPTVVQVERPRSPSRCRRRARSSRSYSPPRVGIAARAHTQRSRSRQRAAPELPLADDGRPNMITATVKSAAVRGKPTRPKRARTALVSLAGE